MLDATEHQAEIVIPGTPTTTKIVFNPQQQELVNELIRESQSRAAKDVRADLAAAKRAEAALKTEVDALRQLQIPETDTTLISTQARLRETEAENATLKADKEAFNRRTALQAAVGKADFVDVAQGELLLREAASATDGTAASLDRLVSDFAAGNPHMIRSRVIGGSGSKQSQGTPQPERIDVSQVFGRGSNAALAMGLMKQSPAEYKRLKTLAQQSGLIG